ncbi:MAG: prepilin peptidase [Oliverpabstia sp.]
MKFYEIFCILFSGVAMIMDLKWEKVYNFWICIGILCGQLLLINVDQTIEMLRALTGMLIPFAVLFPLFLCKMLGTGDIKVFVVLGSVMGVRWAIKCIGWSFLIGAVMAVPLLFFRCDAKERFLYFFTYLNHIFVTKTFPPYLAPGRNPENIHFTIPIFCSVILLTMRGGSI